MTESAKAFAKRITWHTAIPDVAGAVRARDRAKRREGELIEARRLKRWVVNSRERLISDADLIFTIDRRITALKKARKS